MPAPGEQHRYSAAVNPFEQAPTRVKEYTAQEIATLQCRLDRQLGPEYISTRPGAGGGKLHYLAAEKVIGLANEVFGFNGWSSQIQEVQLDFCDESAGRVTLGLSTIVRVTLKDGTFHEDIGYGHIENCKGKAAAFEKAKKEGATDGLKRALRNFGNVLGNCLYDKDYLSKVTRVKVAPTKWDTENLHRHPDFAPTKKETINSSDERKLVATPDGKSIDVAGIDYDDEFDGDLLDGVELTEGHPDEITIQAQQQGDARPEQPTENFAPDSARRFSPQKLPATGAAYRPSIGPKPPNPDQLKHPLPPPQNADVNNKPPLTNVTPQRQAQTHGIVAQNQPPLNQQRQHEPPVGFISSRGADMLTKDDNPPPATNLPRFNPNAESPSIPKTGGVNYDKSKPVLRQSVGIGPPPPPLPAGTSHQQQQSGGEDAVKDPNTPNFINPSNNLGRKIGMPPPSAPSPIPNRGAYKPPGPATPAASSTATKRAFAQVADDRSAAHARIPLADVSNVDGTKTDVAGEESKRPKFET